MALDVFLNILNNSVEKSIVCSNASERYLHSNQTTRLW